MHQYQKKTHTSRTYNKCRRCGKRKQLIMTPAGYICKSCLTKKNDPNRELRRIEKAVEMRLIDNLGKGLF